MLWIPRDRLARIGRILPDPERGGATLMPGAKADARWSDAVPMTAGLWLFMLAIFLPAIIARHHGADWGSIVLDCATVSVSISFALSLFVLFRATAGWASTVRVVLLAAATLLTAVVQTVFDLLFTAWVAEHLAQSWRMVPVDLARASGALLNYVCVFTVNVALYQLSFTRRRSLAHERQLAAAQSAAQNAELELLRLQLNPHFLFNTLNAISSMIITRRNEEAERMTDKLSSFLRASLACDPSELMPVEEELGLTGDYLGIEAVRFGDRLRVDISCAADARDVRVPGMLLQPLVEDAIKCVAASGETVTIAIAAEVEGDTLSLTVNDDAASRILRDEAAGAQVGLRNVRDRLAAHYGGNASLEAAPVPGGFSARIRVPVERAGGRRPPAPGVAG